MESVANPWGQPPSARGSTGRRACRSRSARSREVQAAGELDALEVLYWVGCAAAFDDRNRRVARAVVTCLDAAGVSFAVLGQEESCTGDPARRMGNEYVFQMLAGQRRDAQPLPDGGADDRHGLPALLQHDRQRVRPAGRQRSRSSTTASTSSGSSSDGRLRARRGRAAGSTVTYHDSATWRATTA